MEAYLCMVDSSLLKHDPRGLDGTIMESLKNNKHLKIKKKTVIWIWWGAKRKGKMKNVFEYYTRIEYIRFAGLVAFLVPDGFAINYEKDRKHIKK